MEVIGQESKEELPIVINPAGRAMFIRPLQPENAEAPMLVTVPGMLTEVRCSSPLNALLGISVIPSLSTTVSRLGNDAQ